MKNIINLIVEQNSDKKRIDSFIFEEARRILIDQTVYVENIYMAFIINIIYLMIAISLFYYSFNQARKKGTLINIGE